MNVSMEFEVVFSTEEFLADLTLEFSPTPMCREVSSQVPLTGEYLLTMRAGKAVCCGLQVMFQGFWGGIFIYTLDTPKAR